MSLRIDFTEVQNLWERRQEKFSVSPNWGGTAATMSANCSWLLFDNQELLGKDFLVFSIFDIFLTHYSGAAVQF